MLDKDWIYMSKRCNRIQLLCPTTVKEVLDHAIPVYNITIKLK